MKYTIDIKFKNNRYKEVYYICDDMQQVLFKLRIIEAEYKDTIKKIILTPAVEEKG